MITKIGAARLPEHWQATADEMAAGYPCDRLAKTDVRALTQQLITLKQLAEQTAQNAAIKHRAQEPKEP